MAEKVIVAVDGGPASRAALDWAIQRSKTVEIDLELTIVVEVGWSAVGGPEHEYRTAYEQALWEAVDHTARVAPHLHAKKLVRRGTPSDALITASRRGDLLVIGTNKTGALAGIVHGTLPLKVAGRSECPVVVVPVGWTGSDGPVVVGWTDDGTGDVALDAAAVEAHRAHRLLHIVHAWRIPATVGIDAMGAALASEGIADAHQEALSEVARRIRSQFPDVEVSEVLKQDSAATAIVEASSGASLVVVGSHGRGAVGGLILGSVSHDVLMNMPAPVMVIPEPGAPITVLPEILDEDLL